MLFPMMKKSLVITAITLVAVAMGFSAIAPAIADPAEVIRVKYNILDHTGGVIEGECQEVIANNSNSKGSLVCTGTANEPFPDKAVKLDHESTGGLVCKTDNQGPTENWHTIITPSGNLKHVCHFP
ncbi:MAG: hypothetical protein OEM21_03770 [Nitrosopumilus sp.]|nr:hypothetical protein [Nitrosopumilus sp.]